jgi:hypothetical protein
MVLETSALEEEVARLRDAAALCSQCPPQYHCCYFSDERGGNTGVDIPKGSAATVAGGNARLMELVRSGKAADLGTHYGFQDMRCPALDSADRCTLHARKAELGLATCIDFPVYVKGEGDDRTLVVDGRCYGVMRQLETLRPAAEAACHRHGLSLRAPAALGSLASYVSDAMELHRDDYAHLEP